MSKHLYMPLLVCSFAGMHQLNGMEPVEQKQVECHSIGTYKTTLQKHIANQNWQATLKTEENMEAFLNRPSNQHAHAWHTRRRYATRTVDYGALAAGTTTFALLSYAVLLAQRAKMKPHKLPLPKKILISGSTAYLFAGLSLYNQKKAQTVTPQMYLI